MKKIMVTGASGFVGINLMNYFKMNQVDAMPVSLRSVMPIGIPETTGAIVHLAGKAHDLKNVSAPSEYFEVNTELTKKLFDQFLLSGASTFIFLSSVKASADKVEGELTEENTANPQTVYGQSKLQAETYLLSRQLPGGKRLYILRPCMIHGPGNKGNLNLLYQLVKKGIPYPLAAFENKRSFLSIGNLCFVIHALISRENIASGIYQVADQKPLSTNNVMRIIGEELAKKTRFIKINKSFIRVIARMGDAIYFPLNTERLGKMTDNYVVSTKKLYYALQEPLPISSNEGLRISVRSFSNIN